VVLTLADQEWLDAVNAERKKEQSGAISYEVFEIIMDKLEKEWFNLVSCSFSPALDKTA
jgi:NuA3 HAT complex component NTO1